MKGANFRKRLSTLKLIAKQKKIHEKQKLSQPHFLMAYPYVKWISKIGEVQLLTLRALRQCMKGRA